MRKNIQSIICEEIMKLPENEKVMKSEIKNGVLLRADDGDVDENGRFVSLGATGIDKHAFTRCQKLVNSVFLPNLTIIPLESFFFYVDSKTHYPIRTLEVNHKVTIHPHGLKNCPYLECIVLHGPVNPQDLMRLNQQLPEKLKNVRVAFATFKNFLQMKAILQGYFPKDVAGMIHNIYNALPSREGEPLQSILNRLDDVFSAETAMEKQEKWNTLVPSHKESEKKPSLLNSGLFAIRHDKPIYGVLGNAIVCAQGAVTTYLAKNKGKTNEGVARAEQLQYVIFSTSASRECLAIVIHAFLNEQTGGGILGSNFRNPKGTELVKLLGTSIPLKEQKAIGKVAVHILKKMGMKTPQEQVNFENQIIKNINEGKYDVPNLQLQDDQILTIYGDRKMSDSSHSPKQP